MRTLKLLALLLLCVSVSAVAQNYLNSGPRGKGASVQKQLDLPAITGIHLSISAEVRLSQGDRQAVSIKAQPNIVELINTEVKNGNWNISFTESVKGHGDIIIDLTVTDLESIGLSGSGSVHGQNAFHGLQDLELVISGSGDIKLDFESESVECMLSGSGDMQLAGKVNQQEINITGSGDISAFDLATAQTRISITGSGDAEVQVSDQLEASIVGSGDVHYHGAPAVRSNIIGSGDVYQK